MKYIHCDICKIVQYQLNIKCTLYSKAAVNKSIKVSSGIVSTLRNIDTINAYQL